MRKALKDSKRIVVKVGTSTLTYENGSVNLMRIEKLSRVISHIFHSFIKIFVLKSPTFPVYFLHSYRNNVRILVMEYRI